MDKVATKDEWLGEELNTIRFICVIYDERKPLCGSKAAWGS